MDRSLMLDRRPSTVDRQAQSLRAVEGRPDRDWVLLKTILQLAGLALFGHRHALTVVDGERREC